MSGMKPDQKPSRSGFLDLIEESDRPREADQADLRQVKGGHRREPGGAGWPGKSKWLRKKEETATAGMYLRKS